MNTCYLVGAGDNNYIPTLDETDLSIAADGGYDFLISHGLRCDLLIGDLDSIKDVPTSVEIIKHPVEKDETDMHLSYLEGASRGYSDFVILGGMGGRADHTYANYSLLLYIAKHGGSARMISDTLEVRVICDGGVELFGREGANFSVFAIGGIAEGVSIKGGKYEAEDVSLTPDFPLGVSNSFTRKPISVSVRCGSLLIMKEI